MNNLKLSDTTPHPQNANPAESNGMALLYSLSPRAIWRQVRQEHICFWFACGYLFFEYVRPQTIYPFIDFFPWSAFFAVAALAASFSDKTRKPPGNRISKLIVLYSCIVLLSALFAYNPKISFQHLSDYLNWVIIYFAIVRTITTKTRFFIFFLLYMLCNFKMSQHGFRSWASMGFKYDVDGVGGSPGWFQNSGEFGIQLCIFIPLVIAFVLAVKPHCKKLMALGLYIMPITAIASTVGSSSRGALVGLALASAWSIKTSKYFFRTLFIGSMLVGIVYLAIPPESKARFESSGEDRTSLHRLDRWHKGWATMKKYPWLGVGHRNWDTYYRAKLAYSGPKGSAKVHNIFIESGTEHGLLGLGTLIFIIFSMFVLNKKTRALAKEKNDLFSYYVAHGMDAATIGMLVSSSFVTVLYYPYIWIHAAFVASLYGSSQLYAQQQNIANTKEG